MTRETDAELLSYIKSLSEEEGKEYFMGKRVVDRHGTETGTVIRVTRFSQGTGIMSFDVNERRRGKFFCSSVKVNNNHYYCCNGDFERIVLGDIGCYKCKHGCKMTEPCGLMEEKA